MEGVFLQYIFFFSVSIVSCHGLRDMGEDYGELYIYQIYIPLPIYLISSQERWYEKEQEWVSLSMCVISEHHDTRSDTSKMY